MKSQPAKPIPKTSLTDQTLPSSHRMENLRVDFPDQDLAKRLQCHLSSIVDRDHIALPAGSGLDISVHDGRVVISGEVTSSRDRDLLLNCCRRVAGVIDLDDRELKSSN